MPRTEAQRAARRRQEKRRKERKRLRKQREATIHKEAEYLVSPRMTSRQFLKEMTG